LALLQEGAANCATLDAIYRDCGGFRMGPFELMDLIGIDVNFAVTKSVFSAFFNDPKYRPSVLQQEMVEAERLGRKTRRGFYTYYKGWQRPAPDQLPRQPAPRQLVVKGDPGPLRGNPTRAWGGGRAIC
jgi:3-hydroxybutyryl-CoA dehydrogenase